MNPLFKSARFPQDIPLEYPAPSSQGWEAFLANLASFNMKVLLALLVLIWIFHLIIENGGDKK